MNAATTRVSAALALLAGSGACAHLRPLTDERALALATRNVCGEPDSEGGKACTVRTHERQGTAHRVVIERRPPAGNDVVLVTLRSGGQRVDVQVLERR